MFLSLLWQLFFIANGINKFMDIRKWYITTCLDQLWWHWIDNLWFISRKLFNSNSSFERNRFRC